MNIFDLSKSPPSTTAITEIATLTKGSEIAAVGQLRSMTRGQMCTRQSQLHVPLAVPLANYLLCPRASRESAAASPAFQVVDKF